jgi:hypothetical protein
LYELTNAEIVKPKSFEDLVKTLSIMTEEERDNTIQRLDEDTQKRINEMVAGGLL